ncbi:MAG: hypothetical protein J6386_14980 [Candidatus Synoicihabitans palmerolidicus]|nr:hypothetical protein [Candidatus Synoicihabitans palmerolidicus]
MRNLLAQHHAAGTGIVLACSALKATYRRQLTPPAGAVHFVFLHGTHELLSSRLNARADHYMPPFLARFPTRHSSRRLPATRLFGVTSPSLLPKSSPKS